MWHFCQSSLNNHSPHFSVETELKFVYVYKVVCVLWMALYIPERCAEMNRRWQNVTAYFIPLAASISLPGVVFRGEKLTSGAHLTTKPNVPVFKHTQYLYEESIYTATNIHKNWTCWQTVTYLHIQQTRRNISVYLELCLWPPDEHKINFRSPFSSIFGLHLHLRKISGSLAAKSLKNVH